MDKQTNNQAGGQVAVPKNQSDSDRLILAMRDKILAMTKFLNEANVTENSIDLILRTMRDIPKVIRAYQDTVILIGSQEE